MKRLRAGIIGVGRIGRFQIRAIQSLGCEVSAILSRDPGRGVVLAAELGGGSRIRPYTDIDAFLADPGVDVVHVCTPNLQHFDEARACLLAGKPVLCEKPLTVDPGQSAELAALAMERGIPTAVNFVYRHYPPLARFRAMVASGELGEIFSIRGGFLQGQLLSDAVWDWRVESRLGGPSRAMADIGSHWCDLARWLLGREITEVCADFATFIPERKAPEGLAPEGHAPEGQASAARQGAAGPGGPGRVKVDTEDYASALLRFSGNLHGSFSVSQTTAGARSAFTVEIDGSLASARWDRERADILRVGRRDGPSEEFRLGEGPSPDWDTFRTEAQSSLIASFYTQILEGKRGTHADFADGHANVKAVTAAVASSSERSWKRI